MISGRKLLIPIGLAVVAACIDTPAEPDPQPASITLNPTSITLTAIGATQLVTATVRDGAGNPLSVGVDWTSANTGIAGVSSAGLVTANSVGQTTITATAGTATQNATVTVIDLSGVAFTVTSTTPTTITLGAALTITGTGFDGVPRSELQASIGTVDIPGSAFTSVTATEIVLDVPAACIPEDDVDVTVGLVSGLVVSAPLVRHVVPQSVTNLAVGERLVVSNPANFCFQLPASATPREYVVGLTLPAESQTSLLPHRMTGVAGVSASGPAPAMSAVRAPAASGEPLAFDRDAVVRRLERTRAEYALRAWEHANLDPRSNPGLTLAGGGGAAEGVSMARAAAVPPNVGDVLTLRVPDVEATSACSGFIEVTGTVRVVGTEAIVVTDDGNPVANQLTLADLQELSTQLDNDIIATLESYYGAASDLDANGRVIILLTKEVNSFLNGNVAGFVFSGDLFDRTSCASSDEGEIFYGFVPDQNRTVAQVKLTYPSLIAHEITHIIQNSRRLIVSGNPSAELLSLWTAEGQATFSEEVVGHSIWGNAVGLDYSSSVALQNSAQLSPFDFYFGLFFQLGQYFGGENNLPATPEECTLFGQVNPPIPGLPCDAFAFYGASWAFQRYVSDRYRSTFSGGEQGIHRAVIDANPTLEGTANWAAVLGVTFDNLFVDYATMLYADDRVSGVPSTLEMNSWQLAEITEAVRALLESANFGTDPRGVVLTPESQGFANFTRDRNVRAGSTAYTLVTSGTGSARATAVSVTDASGNPLGTSLRPRLWLLRTQ